MTGYINATEIAETLRRIRDSVGQRIIGQDVVIDEILVAFLARGHVLVEGVPGTAKTLLVRSLAESLGAGFGRIQFTPDLMPSDMTGVSVFSEATRGFEFRAGPVFTDLLLVDEINRMPPRTQAALLECMEERQVTVDGVRHDLASFFSVFATQNPIEFEGTYPLPEAQLDRFLLKIRVPYPETADEVGILSQAQGGFDARHLEAVNLTRIDPALLHDGRREVRGVTVEASLLAYIVPDDVKEAALPVLRHRLVLKPEADLEGITADQALQDVIRSVEIPR